MKSRTSKFPGCLLLMLMVCAPAPAVVRYEAWSWAWDYGFFPPCNAERPVVCTESFRIFYRTASGSRYTVMAVPGKAEADGVREVTATVRIPTLSTTRRYFISVFVVDAEGTRKEMAIKFVDVAP